MKVRVRLFSIYRERAGVAQTDLEVPAGCRVRGVVAELTRRFPRLALAGATDSVLYSVNREYASAEAPVTEGDEVAILPPVSGGTAASV